MGFLVFSYSDEHKATDSKTLELVWDGPANIEFFQKLMERKEDLGINTTARGLSDILVSEGLFGVCTAMETGTIELFEMRKWL